MKILSKHLKDFQERFSELHWTFRGGPQDVVEVFISFKRSPLNSERSSSRLPGNSLRIPREKFLKISRGGPT